MWVSKFAWKRNKKGIEELRTYYAEGTIDGHLYEQKTPAPKDTPNENSVRKTLNHTVDKNAKIAVLFDKNGVFTDDMCKQGIQDFLQYPHNHGRVLDLIVVTESGNLREYKI